MRRKICVADHDTRKPVSRVFEDGGSTMVDGSRKERSSPQKNSFVLLKDMTKHRAKWKVGKIVDAIVGKNESGRVTRSRHIIAIM